MPANRKPRIRIGRASHTYHIESATRPGIFHTANAYRLTCSCEAGRRGRRCWHLATAIVYDQWRKDQRTKSAPAVATTPGGIPRRPGDLLEAFGA